MADLLLTLYCNPADASLIAALLRDETRQPVHQRNEIVYGFDFSDANAAERVDGRLARCAIELCIDEHAAMACVERIGAMARKGPVRWRLSPVNASGRVP
jgi:hypothetical protein